MKFYILALVLLSAVSFASLPGSKPAKKDAGGSAKIVFKSTDGGKTWQDISKGLPENLRADSIQGTSFFANDKGLFLRLANGLYHNEPNASTPSWTKEAFSKEDSSMAAVQSGRAADNYWGVNLKKRDGTSVWSPMFEHYHEPRIRSVFETAGGTIFIGIDRGIFRSTDNGKTWKHVHTGTYAGHMAEYNGVLLAASMRKIIRSTDNGENWQVVGNEGDVVFDVKQVNGGFAAMTATSASNTRGVSTSYDDGKTWQTGDASRPDKAVIDSIWRTWNDRPGTQAFQTSITQVGENFFSNHRDGIFRSSDKGKTWKLLFPSVEDKVFGLLFSGNVIYAVRSIRSKKGC